MTSSWRPTFRILGMALMAVGITMVPAFVVSMISSEYSVALTFIVLAAAVFFLGLGLFRCFHPLRGVVERVHIADGLLIVTLCWLAASIVGALPYLLVHVTDDPVSAFFESCSGFTTTGATALLAINHLPKGILFWRSMTCWMGGIGILVFGIALMPALGLNGQRLTAAESHGPILDKITPNMISTFRVIALVYLGMTLIETILLTLGGMTLFNGLLHSMSTVSTGGFSRYDNSIGHFDSTYIRIVILSFMILSGMNFTLYINLVRHGIRALTLNTELKLYGLLLVGGSLVITIVLGWSGTYDATPQTVSCSVFQTVSVLTTTGFTTTDYHLWPTFCYMILLLLMFTGACSSSPGGGIKVVRLAIVLKLIRHGLSKRLHSSFFEDIKLNHQGMPGDKVSGAVTVPFLYLTALFSGALLLTLMGNDLPSAFSAGLSCLCNTGAGFGGIGPSSLYTSFNGLSKLVLSALMIGGRLELYALIVLVIPKYWTKDY